MIYRIRIACAIVLALGCVMMESKAQPLQWNLPCTTITFHNVAPFTTGITLNTSGGMISSGMLEPGEISDPYPTIPPLFYIYSVVSDVSHNPVPMPAIGPPPYSVPITAGFVAGCVRAEINGIPFGGCFDAWLDQTTCTLYIAPTTCPCNP
jgi:hypothetical protein